MYFASGAARALVSAPPGPNLSEEPLLAVATNSRRSLFCTLSARAVAVWCLRPPTQLALLARTNVSVELHGENVDVRWSNDGHRLIIKTAVSHIVLVSVIHSPGREPNSIEGLSPDIQRRFLPGPGEGTTQHGVSLKLEGVIQIDGQLQCISPRMTHLLFSTTNPSAVQRIPWPGSEAASGHWLGHETWLLNGTILPWLEGDEVNLNYIYHARGSAVEGWVTSDGRAYLVRFHEQKTSRLSEDLNSQATASTSGSEEVEGQWSGTCIHPLQKPATEGDLVSKAVCIAINVKFSIIAIGLEAGAVRLSNFPLHGKPPDQQQHLVVPDVMARGKTGNVTAMEWTSDGYAVAIGWEHGWAVISVGGRFLASTVGTMEHVSPSFQDAYMLGIRGLFWGPGNFELYLLASQAGPPRPKAQLFVLPFAKSATTSQQAPDNTRYAFLQMDDRVLIYRGADQPDMSVINPESDVWQHIKTPLAYMATNWPMRHATISSDGRLVAVAGRRGLIHYSTASGRWKLFNDPAVEQSFIVRGGMIWFHHVLIVAIEASRSFQVRLYSRDLDLTVQNVLHTEVFPSAVVLLSLVDNSLLVYTADNSLYHFLVIPTAETIKLHMCGSISFEGVVAAPGLVRCMSWMIPSSHKNFGNPEDDLLVATILLLVGGQLVLLRPRKGSTQELKYDMQILADHIEFCWIHLRGIGSLENSLWGYDGGTLRVWLDALNIDMPQTEERTTVPESVSMTLDFYPLSVLMDKGIIIGAEQEHVLRSSLPFAMFRFTSSSHLFLQHVLRYHLGHKQVTEAVAFASHYQHLVFFAHALEVLLHTILESEDDREGGTESLLPTTVEFLDHFDACLDVVVGCARKTEMARWQRLFDAVGNPKVLFETCLESKRLACAASYLLVLHNMEQLDETYDDAVRLLKRAIEEQEWAIAKDLLRFLRSTDDSGGTLTSVMKRAGLDVEIDTVPVNL